MKDCQKSKVKENVISSDEQYFNWNVFVPYILNKVFIL